MSSAQSHVSFNAVWLREMRERLGWSTTEAANQAREVARYFGDTTKIPQQLISKFENGGMKSSPRWLGYVQRAMALHINRNNLAAGRLWDLRLPQELKDFLQDRARQAQDGEADLFQPSDEEWEWIDLLRRLDPEQRNQVVSITRSLARSTQGPTLHSPGREFRTE